MIGELVFGRSVYVAVAVLLAIGLYGMLAKRNLAKKLVGMVIFQSAIYLFFIQGATKRGASVPIIEGDLAGAQHYVNPLPHLLILTALVVGVGVFGVALSFLLRLHRRHGTFDEQAIIADLSAEEIVGHAVHDDAAGDGHDGEGHDGEGDDGEGHDGDGHDGHREDGHGDDGHGREGEGSP